MYSQSFAWTLARLNSRITPQNLQVNLTYIPHYYTTAGGIFTGVVMIASIAGALTLLVIIVVIAVVCCSIVKKKRRQKALLIGSATSEQIVSHFISNIPRPHRGAYRVQ